MAYDANQNQNIDTVLGIGVTLHAPELAILAMLCLGRGENDFHSYGCNPSDHCGFFQLSASLQRLHNYEDVGWWAHYAYQRGNWVHGGLVSLAQTYPNETPGYLANLCQGAFANLQAGADYYDRFRAEALELYHARIGGYDPGSHQVHVSPEPGGGVGFQLPPPAEYDSSPLIRAAGGSMGLHGRHAQHNAGLVKQLVNQTSYCTEDGPHA